MKMRWQVIGSVLFLWLVIAAIAFADTTPQAGVSCQEKGWYFGLITASGDSIKIVAHGPLHVWGTDSYTLKSGDNKVKVNTDGMWRTNPSEIEVMLYHKVYGEGGEPYFKVETILKLKQNGFVCQWLSEITENGYQWSFGNNRGLASRAHPTHRDLQGPGTLLSPGEWR